MSNRVPVKYVGPHDEVVIVDGQVELTVKHGETIEVSHDLARGVKGAPLTEIDGDGNELVVDADANIGALGGLLDQPDNWEAVKAPKAAHAAGEEKGQ